MRASLRLLIVMLTVGTAACDTPMGAGTPTISSEANRAVEFYDGRDPTSTTGLARALPVRMTSAPGIADALPAADEGPRHAEDAPVERLVRRAAVDLEVDSLEEAVASVRGLAASAGGFVADQYVETRGPRHRASRLELRVPAAELDRVVSGLRPIGRAVSVRLKTQAVGEEYVDVEARIANARRLEDRLIHLVAERTGELEDVLAAERELARVRETIERHEGRLRYLDNRIRLASIHVSLFEPGPVLDRSVASTLVAASRSGWRNFMTMVVVAIQALGVIAPLALLALPTWYGWGRLRPFAVRATGRGFAQTSGSGA